MSKITLAPNASGTAVFTVAAPGTSTNQTLTLPDATATLVGDSATQTLTNKSIASTQLTGDVAAARITTALNASGSAPIYACRAWVSFGPTGTILSSGNVSSVTGGPDTFTINFATALPTANFALSGSTDNTGYGIPAVTARSTSAVTVVWGNRGTAGGGGTVWNSIMIFA
jgi:hypothetical protein